MSTAVKVVAFATLAIFGYVVVYGAEDLPPVVKQVWSLTPVAVQQSMPSLHNIIGGGPQSSSSSS